MECSFSDSNGFWLRCHGLGFARIPLLGFNFGGDMLWSPSHYNSPSSLRTIWSQILWSFVQHPHPQPSTWFLPLLCMMLKPQAILGAAILVLGRTVTCLYFLSWPLLVSSDLDWMCYWWLEQRMSIPRFMQTRILQAICWMQVKQLKNDRFCWRLLRIVSLEQWNEHRQSKKDKCLEARKCFPSTIFAPNRCYYRV